MTMRNGGPAFPFEYHNQTSRSQGAFFTDNLIASGGAEQYAGMTLREYFMAHAPASPQPWFRAVMPPKPDGSIWVSEDGLRKYDNPRTAEAAEGDCCSRLNDDAIRAWDADCTKQYFIQWPAAWADEQLKVSNK